jgi:hypothetical protein
MVTMATGSIDTAAPMGVSPQNATAGGMSMMMGAVLKRAKRTIRNMEQEFLSPLIHKIAWRYMQFDTERYPVTDYRFRVHGALGAQAREFEVAQLGQLLQTVPPGSPAYWLVLKGIIQNYNIDDKDQLTQIADSFLQQALNPQPPQPDFDQQVDMAGQQLKQQEFQLKTQQAVVDNIRKDSEVLAEADRDRGEAIWNQSEAVLNIAKAKTEQDKAEASIVLSKAKAAEALAGKPQSSSSLGTQPTEYLALVEALKDSFKDVAHTTANRINASLNNSLITLSNKQNVMSMDPLNTKLDQILKQQQQQALANADQSSINIDRGEDGRVLRIGNRPVRRGPAGELQGVD